MRKLTIPVLFCSALTIASAAHAAPDMKPGLWQVTIKSDQMRQMPKISPQQAAMMKRMGISVPSQNSGGMTTKVCITKKMIENDEVTMQDDGGDCKTSNARQNGSHYSADIICNGPDMKGRGKVEGTYTSTRFNSTYKFTGTSHGRKANHNQTSSGKWLGSNCGNVKPFTQ